MSGNVADRPRARPRTPGAVLFHPRPAAVWGGLSVIALAMLLSVSRAFNTADMDLLHRSALFMIVCGLVAGQFLLFASSALKLAMFRRSRRWAAWLGAFLATWCLATLEVEALKYTPLLPKKPDPLLEFAVFILPIVALICLATFAVHRAAAAPPPSKPKPEPRPAGERRLVGDWPQGSVLSVQAQDHYLRVRTATQTTLVRGRLSDALARLSRSDGMQVHRSWWVARDQVAMAQRQGRDYLLVLKDGAAVPVSRNRVPALRQAGWL